MLHSVSHVLSLANLWRFPYLCYVKGGGRYSFSNGLSVPIVTVEAAPGGPRSHSPGPGGRGLYPYYLPHPQSGQPVEVSLLVLRQRRRSVFYSLFFKKSFFHPEHLTKGIWEFTTLRKCAAWSIAGREYLGRNTSRSSLNSMKIKNALKSWFCREVKVRNTSEAVLRPQYTHWPLY